MKRHQLKNLSIEELSTVDRPANQHARATLVKGAGAKVKALLKSVFGADDALDNEATVDVEKMAAALAVSVHDILQKAETPEELEELLEKSLEQFRDAVLKDSMDDDDGEDDEVEEGDTGDETPPATKRKLTPEGKGMKKNVLKGLSPEAAAYVESLEKSVADIKKTADTATEQLAAQSLEKRARDLVGKSNLDVAEVSALLKAAEGNDVATKAVENMVKRQIVLVDKSALFEDAGEGGETIDGNPAEAALHKAAAEIRKGNPKLSPQQAFSKACDANPGLYEQWMDDNEDAAQA